MTLLSAVFIILSFPVYDVGWLAWIGLVPLFLAIAGKRPIFSFLLSYLFGIVCSAAIYGWIFEAPGYTIIHHTILAFFVGSYTAIFGLIFGFMNRRLHTLLAMFTVPFVWVATEYIRSTLFFLSLPFPVLGHTQYQYSHLIQIANLTGAYGVSFLIVWVNLALSMILLGVLDRFKNSSILSGSASSPIGIFLVSGMAVLLVFVTLFYGWHELSQHQDSKKLRVSVIQGNIDREKKLNARKNAGYIMDRYTELTLEASKENPDLIVWPEAATPGLVLKNLSLQQQLIRFIKKIDRPFVIGSSEYAKFTKEVLDRQRTGNTALYFSPSGQLLGQYLKLNLIPFGEYIPYEDWFPWPEFIVPKENRATDVPGKEYTLFELDESKFGVVICSEGAFPNLFRKFVKDGANFMLNITNEGWFGEAALHQKVAASVFRAVENRVALARATNTGISCFIDPSGRVYGRVQKSQKQTFVAGHMTEDILLSENRTFFTIYGNLFAFVCLGVTAMMITLSMIRKN